ncbi:MAG: hypothetical protein HRU19_18095 [Pseudobacteriovorax sp.]|nr:hypothetical protein [Pseudobacteriovorax sp.]
MRVFLTMVIGLGLIACEESYQKSAPFQAPETLKDSADIRAQGDLIPTNPTAGQVGGKADFLDPIESQRRAEINVIQPIVWGTSMGGISTSTTLAEAKQILANPVSQSTSFTIYSESLAVFWSGIDPNVPLILVALEGYAGKLQLPAPYPAISTKSDLTPYLSSESDGDEFARALERSFQGQPNTFDCIASRTCRVLRYDDGSQEIDFSNGQIIMNADLTVRDIYTPLPQTLPPRLTGDVNLQATTIGTYALATSRVTLEAGQEQALDLVRSPFSQYAEPRFDSILEGFVLYYDDLNFGVQWGEQNTVSLMFARKNYIGDILFDVGSDTRKKIGDSLIDLMTVDDQPNDTTTDDVLVSTTAPALIRDLDRLINQRAADYNCITESTCELKVFFDRFELNLNTSTIVVDRNNQLTLNTAAVHAARFEI